MKNDEMYRVECEYGQIWGCALEEFASQTGENGDDLLIQCHLIVRKPLIQPRFEI
jgi:hypothetical protein